MLFPTYAYQLASAPIEAAGALTFLDGWLKAFEAATGHRVDPMAFLTILTPVILTAILQKNPMLILTAIYANLGTLFPASLPATVRTALEDFHTATPLQLAA